uniref:Fe2OG dioxygenase domain-containing protein n=1 Tax=Spongospora subterranea TaxID=70186 RepID=A0A0H5R7R0_9EUKA|eukprot:CRZ10210.1 hypothetical protein [Spongospora subterranea]
MTAKTIDSTSEGNQQNSTGPKNNRLFVKVSVVVALLSIIAVIALQYIGYYTRKESFGDEQKLVLSPNEMTPEPMSKEGFIPVHVDFTNKHEEDMDLYWANGNGTEVKMDTIAPNNSKQFNSYVGHVWVWRVSSTQEYVRSSIIDSTQATNSYSRYESDFHETYAKEHGFDWINVYPRGPVNKWIPDPVNIGYETKRLVSPAKYTKEGGLPDQSSTTVLNMKTMSTSPKIFLIEEFLSEDECDHIIQEAIDLGDMKRSGVKTTGEHIPSRTSTNTWIAADKSEIVENVFKRGFSVMKLPFNKDSWKNHSESLQVLLYDVSQEYQPHDDFFKPSEYPTYRTVQQGNNRYATLFLYLSDVEGGGETVFPRFNGEYSEDACTDENGFRVKPKKGNAALFFSMLPDGNLDQNALHGGCPVITGKKWAANFWFWDESAAEI